MNTWVILYLIGYVLSLVFVVGPYFIQMANSGCLPPDVDDYVICTFFALFFNLVWFIAVPIILIGTIINRRQNGKE